MFSIQANYHYLLSDNYRFSILVKIGQIAKRVISQTNAETKHANRIALTTFPSFALLWAEWTNCGEHVNDGPRRGQRCRSVAEPHLHVCPPRTAAPLTRHQRKEYFQFPWPPPLRPPPSRFIAFIYSG